MLSKWELEHTCQIFKLCCGHLQGCSSTALSSNVVSLQSKAASLCLHTGQPAQTAPQTDSNPTQRHAPRIKLLSEISHLQSHSRRAFSSNKSLQCKSVLHCLHTGQSAKPAVLHMVLKKHDATAVLLQSQELHECIL